MARSGLVGLHPESPGTPTACIFMSCHSQRAVPTVKKMATEPRRTLPHPRWRKSKGRGPPGRPGPLARRSADIALAGSPEHAAVTTVTCAMSLRGEDGRRAVRHSQHYRCVS